jgi:uncharacterized membrane protein YeaQ/YmgE (transglycosylase-associated protein family)
MLWHILGIVLLGLVVGWIARLFVREHMGWISTAILGILGGYVGGTLGSVVFKPHKFDIHPPIQHSFWGALVGAIILLLVYRFFKKRVA